MVILLINVKIHILLRFNIMLIIPVMRVVLEQELVQVTQQLSNVYQDTVYLQVVLV
jgi:hypothetical protein